MKLLHTGDLHIGKKIFELSMLEEQKHVLQQILQIAKEEKVDAVLIAGDVYDRSVPATEAVELLDEFLTEMVQCGIKVIMISGNHDSPERVGFASKILEHQGLHIAGTYDGALKKVILEDEWGEVEVFCLPFVKPGVVGEKNCADAVRAILKKEGIKQNKGRSVLITHYFVTGPGEKAPLLSESETTIDVGGIDNVPIHILTGFDYVALGHIHKYQQLGNEPVYYAGTPLKYSFTEAGSEKSVNIVELCEKGNCKISRRVLNPIHEMRCIKGKLSDLIRPEVVQAKGVSPEDYIQATLTDREELIDPIGTLRSVYPNTLQIILEKNVSPDIENMESRLHKEIKGLEELFGDFYELLTGETLNEKQVKIVREIMEEGEWK